MSRATQQLVRMLDELGRITDEPGALTRTFLSPAMRRANDRVAGWMRAAGLAVREDAIGNVMGRRDGSREAAPTLLLGSHLDTVRNAGRFDGALGVLLPIVALGELRRRGVSLPYAVDVLGFSEEEGVRFASAYLGSKGFTGGLSAADLKLRDSAGVSVQEAMNRWNGVTPRRSTRAGAHAFRLKPAHSRRDLLGYVEVHIEQGPVLERRNLAVGVVSAIAGQSRFKVTWTGRAGHAGTTPMNLRQDALTAAAEFALAAETLARSGAPALVATIGSLMVAPGAANVIPGRVVHTLDVRHPADPVRRRAIAELQRQAMRIARRRGLKVVWELTQDNSATPCSSSLTKALERSVKRVQGRSISLVSGAGHDGVVVSALTSIAMLFVRCRDGLSHHPDEYAAPRDLGVALDVMVDFLQRIAKENPAPAGSRRGER